MEQERLVEFRTVRHQIRVADIEIKTDSVKFIVKRKGVKDAFTLEEMLKAVFGQEMRCVVYDDEKRVLKILK